MPAPSALVMYTGSRLCTSSEDTSMKSDTRPSTQTVAGILAMVSSGEARMHESLEYVRP